MQVIHLDKKTPKFNYAFFRQFIKSPRIISVIGGLESGKSTIIKEIFGINMSHGRRRKPYEVYGEKCSSTVGDLVILEWQLELSPFSLKEDAKVLKIAAKTSDLMLITPYEGTSVIDYASCSFVCQFLDASEALFVFSPCSDIEEINDRAKIALSKRRVYALPNVTSQDFTKKLDTIREVIYNEINRHEEKSLHDYHSMLDYMAITTDDCDHSYDIDAFLEQQCFMTLKQVARSAFTMNIKPKLPIEEAQLAIDIEQCLEGLNACGRKLVLRPTTTFSTDIKNELKSIFKEWKKENYKLSKDLCETAYLEFKKQKALDPTLSSSSLKLIGPAKKEFVTKLADLEAMPTVVSRKRKLAAPQEGSVKRQRVAAEGPLKKGITFNDAKLDKNSPPEVQRMNRDLTALKLFRNVFFRNALGETPFYRLTNANQKIIVRLPLNKSFVEYVDSYRIDTESGEKIQFDQATRNKIDAALLSAKQRGVIPTSALQKVVKAAFGYRANSTNSTWLLNAMGIEEDITFHFKLLEVTVNNQPCKFNKFTVKAKTRMTVIKHIVAYFKVLTTTTEKEKQQEIFDAFRESCFGEQADLVKNEFFELFFDTMDHTTIDIPDDPTEEEHSVHLSREQPMDVSEDVVAKSPCLNFNLPVDAMMEDEALLTTGSHEEEEEEFCPSSQYSLADNIICLDDDD